MSKVHFVVSIMWAILFGIIPEDTRYFCALMAILFAVFYLAERTNEKE